MDFNKFFRIIHTGMDSYNLYDLIVEFFAVANDSLLITPEMASNWIKGNNISYNKQFKEQRKFKPFDDARFIKFLKSHTNKRWVDIQNKFKEIISYPYDKSSMSTKQDEIAINETENASLNETPSCQMTKEFERLISKYKIAYFICSELTYSQKVDEFLETVKIELLAEFVHEQEDDTYKKISKFNETLYGFNISLDDLNPSTARQFHLYTNFLRTLDVTLYEILTQITEDRDRLSKRLSEGIQPGQNLDEEIKQLAVMEYLLDLYAQLDALYSTICNGKTLLVF